MVSSIGDFYNTKGVVVGQAIGMIAPPNTPLPADTISPFDPAAWLASTIALGTPTAGTFTLSATGGPFGTTVYTTAAIAFGATAAAATTAFQAVLPAGYTVTVTGTAPNFVVSIDGPASDNIVITGNGASLTPTVATNLVTPSLWQAAGGTDQGWQVNYMPTVQDINIEEQPTPVQQQVTTAKFEAVANLAEDAVLQLQWALSATAAIQAPAPVNVYGKTTLTLQPTLPTYAICVEAANRFGFPRRYYVPVATCATNVGQTFRRAAAKRMVPVTFTSICPMSAIQVVEITANHT